MQEKENSIAELWDHYQNMLVAYVISGQVDEIQYIINKGFDIRECPNLLQTAVDEGHFKVVELLLRHKARVEWNDNQAVISSICNQDYEIAKLLVRFGADLFCRGLMALHLILQ